MCVYIALHPVFVTVDPQHVGLPPPVHHLVSQVYNLYSFVGPSKHMSVAKFLEKLSLCMELQSSLEIDCISHSCI